MRAAFFLASPRVRAQQRHHRLRRQLDRLADLPLTRQERGYLDLAETLLLGSALSEGDRGMGIDGAPDTPLSR